MRARPKLKFLKSHDPGEGELANTYQRHGDHKALRLLKTQLFAALCALDLLIGPARAIIDGRTLGALTSGANAQMRARTVKIVTFSEHGEDNQFCSGYVWDDQTILSAAHCFDSDTKESLDRGLVFAVSPDGSRKVQVELINSQLDSRADVARLRIHGRLPIDESPRIAWQGCEAHSPVAVLGYGFDERESFGGEAKLAEYRVDFTGDFFGERSLVLHPLRGKICDGDSGGPAFCFSHGQWIFGGVVRELSYVGRSLRANAPEIPLCRSARQATITPASAIVDLVPLDLAR